MVLAQPVRNQELAPRQAAWQQRVDHKISAVLDTLTHTIKCEQTIVYTNNSPVALHDIWFHIYPEAFHDNGTAYGKEAITDGNFRYLNAPKTERGSVTGLNFSVNGIEAVYTRHETYRELIRVSLPAALEPGTSITISTPFVVKLPWLFSRMGVNENIYAVTQWYPKPAAFDVNGWNLLPYQDQGEFYSEFGSYDVSITAPANMRIAATGELAEKEELEWLRGLSAGTNIRPDNAETKTLHYHQDHVSDFAWFASNEFVVRTKTLYLADSTPVQAYAFYKRHYQNKKLESISGDEICENIDIALQYYSKRVGKYPFANCTVVIGPLQGAGGMEYPMITICGEDSKGTIVHEVGHNWFEQMLGSQERNHPWMDESINTFYHQQASGEELAPFLPGDMIKTNGGYSQFRLASDFGLAQNGNLHSSDYSNFNYGVIVYGINPVRFQYLQEYMGVKMFDSCMKTYFKKWQYKHPLPGDMQDVFESVSHKKLSWFFQNLMGKQAPDYAISKVKKTQTGYQIQIKNKGEYAVPVKLSARQNKSKFDYWLNGRDTSVVLQGKYNEFSLNPSGYLPETNLANNDARAKGLCKTKNALRFGFIKPYYRGTNRIWFFPSLFTFNSYDGYAPGLVLSNMNVPRRKFEFVLIPAYGIKSGSMVGTGRLQKNIVHRSKALALTEIRLLGSSYSMVPDKTNDYYGNKNQFYHIAPIISTWLRRKKSYVQHHFDLEADYNRTRVQTKFPFQIGGPVNRDAQNQIMRLMWQRQTLKKAAPADITLFAEAGSNAKMQGYNNPYSFAKTGFSVFRFIPVHNTIVKKFGISLRAFGETMLMQKNKTSSSGVYLPVVSGANGANDYAYRYYLMGRSENFNSNSRWSNQVIPGTNSLTMTPNILAGSYLAGAQIAIPILPALGLSVVMTGIAADQLKDKINFNVNHHTALYYTGTFRLGGTIGKNNLVEFNLPFVYSNNLLAGSKKGMLNHFNFTLNLNLFKPESIILQTMN